MKRSATIIFFLFPFIAVAQSGNFNSLFTQQAQFFTGNINSFDLYVYPSSIKVMHFNNSVVNGTTTQYSGFRSIRFDNFSAACIDSAGKSWFGSDAIDVGSGIQIYSNQLNEPIVVQTQAILNQYWDMYIYPNGDVMRATVTGIGTGSVLNPNDVTKTITLDRTDSIGNPLNDFMNGKELVLSQDSGWIKFMNVYLFPNDSATVDRIPYVQIPTRGIVYDYQPGDVFQHHSSCFTFFGGTNPGSYTELQIQSRQDYPAGDSVVYTVLQSVLNLTFNPNPFPHVDSSFNQIVTSIKFDQLSTPLFNAWPDEAILDYNFQSNYTYLYSYGLNPVNNFCTSEFALSYTIGTFSKFNTDTCFLPPFEPIMYTYTFVPGLGQTNYIDNEQAIFGFECNDDLIGYTRGGIPCGNHISFTGFDEVNQQIGWTLSPNPVDNALHLHVKQSGAYQLKLFSAEGRLLLEKEITDLENVFSVTDLSSGTYFVELSQNGNRSYKRFIVAR